MRKLTAGLLHTIWYSISCAGITPAMSDNERRAVMLMNRILLSAALVNLAMLVIYFSAALYLSAFVNVAACFLFFLAICFNHWHLYKCARALFVLTVNLFIAGLSVMEGARTGAYMYYFPALIAMAFLVRVYTSYRELIVTYIFTILCIFCTVYLVPTNTGIQKMTVEVANSIFHSRLMLSVSLTMYISYLILRSNKIKEEQLLAEKQFTDAIFNTSLDSVFIVRMEDHSVADCNQRTVELFEIKDKRRVAGSHLEDWLDKEQISKFSTLWSAGQPPVNMNWQGELSLVTRTGRSFFGYASVVSFEYRQTSFLKISILDITNVKSAEFELMKAKERAESAARLKTRFLSNMSHELRTPLNGIIGAANLLLEEEFLETQRPHLDILRFSSEHMLNLVNDILDHTKMEAGKVELLNVPVNMRAFSRQLVSRFSPQVAAKGLQFKTFVDPALDMELLTDELRLNQVLNNLLSNAIKFTHQGHITVAVNRILATSSHATVQFMIQDTGIGIPEDKRKEIFESFTQADIDTTRKYGGTGLGLTITKDILKLFGSELVMQSEVGKGTKFVFMLELGIAPARQPMHEEAASVERESLQGLRVLVAEDNPVNMSVARSFLSRWGVDVEEAVNGKEAVEKFSPDRFHLLLLDLEMPEMDGTAALHEIRKVDGRVPVLAFTAAVYDDIEQDLMQKGFTDFIHKPFRPNDLFQKISGHAPAR
jgi:signal transduction histidine kinase/CheY-like chemotaxis protein